MHELCRAFAAACVVVSLAAFGDGLALGNGRAGDVTIDAPATVVNRSGILRSSATAGSRTIETLEGLLAVGDLAVLVTLQVPAGDVLPSDGDTLRVDDASVGRFEMVTVNSVSGTSVTLEAPLARDWAAEVTQVIFVPQYQTLTITENGTLEAPAWDGQLGGVLAVAVKGVLTNSGRVHADGRGFRGGSSGLGDVGPFPSELTRNGEGLLRGAWPLFRANAPTSVGGGISHSANPFTMVAGGGGANASRGGTAPATNFVDNGFGAGGFGGLRVAPAGRRVILGGGAAGTAQGDSVFTTPGGAGGGALLIAAGEITGSGTFSATGVAGAPTHLPSNTRQGSAGAGGTIVIDVVGSVSCARIDASGGEGQSVTGCCVPSAAGGAGRIFVSAHQVSCELRAVSGLTGTANGDPGGGTPTSRLPGEVDVREAALGSANPLKFASGCSSVSGEFGGLVATLVAVLARRRRSS